MITIYIYMHIYLTILQFHVPSFWRLKRKQMTCITKTFRYHPHQFLPWSTWHQLIVDTGTYAPAHPQIQLYKTLKHSNINPYFNLYDLYDFLASNDAQPTVDERKTANHLIDSLSSHYLQGFVNLKWCKISSINCMLAMKSLNIWLESLVVLNTSTLGGVYHTVLCCCHGQRCRPLFRLTKVCSPVWIISIIMYREKNGKILETTYH